MIKRTRIGGAWVASALSALVLVLLLIFILENGQRVNIGYFGFHGHLPLGVALLFAAALGGAAGGDPRNRAYHAATDHGSPTPQNRRQARSEHEGSLR